MPEQLAACVDIADGSLLWRYHDRESPYFSAPAVDDKLVVIGCRDQRVHAIDRGTGVKAWTFAARGSVDGSPVICGDKVAVGADDGRVYLLDLATGRSLWSYETGGRIAGSVAVCRGMIIAGSDDGSVYAFGPPDGAAHGK